MEGTVHEKLNIKKKKEKLNTEGRLHNNTQKNNDRYEDSR